MNDAMRLIARALHVDDATAREVYLLMPTDFSEASERTIIRDAREAFAELAAQG